MAQQSTARGRGRAVTVAAWILQSLLAVMFLFAGVSKLLGAEPMVNLFEDVGAGQWLRYVVGALEVAGAVGVLLPPLAALAAACLAALMAGAFVSNLTVIDDDPDLVVPLVVLVVAVVVAVLRRDDFPALRARLNRSRG